MVVMEDDIKHLKPHCVERPDLWHWEQVRFLLAGGRWPVKQTVEQKSCVDPFLWNAVWPLSRTCNH